MRLLITLRLTGRMMDKVLARFNRRWAPFAVPVHPGGVWAASILQAWKVAGRLAA